MLSWIEGTLIYILLIIGVPFIIGLLLSRVGDEVEAKAAVFCTVFIVLFVVMLPGSDVVWHYAVEEPSVQTETITVKEWVPAPGVGTNITNANELMLVTTDGRGFINDENFLFGKFDTRDLLFNLKPNGVYVIKYYGWREGFNSGYPNILSIEKVVDESKAVDVSYDDYFGVNLRGGAI